MQTPSLEQIKQIYHYIRNLTLWEPNKTADILHTTIWNVLSWKQSFIYVTRKWIPVSQSYNNSESFQILILIQCCKFSTMFRCGYWSKATIVPIFERWHREKNATTLWQIYHKVFLAKRRHSMLSGTEFLQAFYNGFGESVISVLSWPWHGPLFTIKTPPLGIRIPIIILRRSYGMMASSNGNIFRVTGHLCGEFTLDRWIPAQRPVTRSFDVLWSASE